MTVTHEGSPDPVQTDPDKYSAVFENNRVRVLKYHDAPGQLTSAHHHPDFVLYAFSGFSRRLTLPDGTATERDFEAGDVIWMDGHTHIGENIGSTDTDVLIVELKE